MEKFIYSHESKSFIIDTTNCFVSYPSTSTASSPLYVSSMTIEELEQLIRRVVREELQGEKH